MVWEQFGEFMMTLLGNSDMATVGAFANSYFRLISVTPVLLTCELKQDLFWKSVNTIEWWWNHWTKRSVNYENWRNKNNNPIMLKNKIVFNNMSIGLIKLIFLPQWLPKSSKLFFLILPGTVWWTSLLINKLTNSFLVWIRFIFYLFAQMYLYSKLLSNIVFMIS